MPPTTTIASGRCVCEPILVERAAGNRPKMAVRAVIITGRTRFSAPCRMASSSGSPCNRIWLKYEISSSPSMIATPKIEMNPTAAEMLKLVPVKQQGPNAAQRERDDVGEDHDRVEHVAERDVQQDEDHAPATAGTMNIRRCFGLLHLLELAAPDRAIRGLEEVLGRGLGFGHGAGQVAAADAELERDQPLPLLAIDRRGAVPFELSVRVGRPVVAHRRDQIAQAAAAACC